MDIEERLVNLESKLGQQDYLLDVLNKTVYEQQKKIDEFEKLTIALEVSERCLVMGHGQIVFEGTPSELRDNRYIRKEPGPIKDPAGRTIGRHVGLSFYTLGQRQGLGIGGIKAKGAQKGQGEHQPWFVARKDIDRNTLWVVQGHDHPWLLSQGLQADDASWCAGVPPAPGVYAAKTRYRQADAACTLRAGADGHTSPAFGLDFSEAQWAVTPGQSAVLYDGEVCLGGGVIDAATAQD